MPAAQPRLEQVWLSARGIFCVHTEKMSHCIICELQLNNSHFRLVWVLMVPFEVHVSARSQYSKGFKMSGPAYDNMVCIKWVWTTFHTHPINSAPWDMISIRVAKCKRGVKERPKVVFQSRMMDTQRCRPNYLLWCGLLNIVSHSAPVCDSLPKRTPSLASLQVKQKPWHFKDDVFLRMAAESPRFPFDMIPISTNLCHCTQKYPASSKNVFAERKKESKAIQERKS